MSEQESKEGRGGNCCPCSGNERTTEKDDNAMVEEAAQREEVKEVSNACKSEGALRVIVGKRRSGDEEKSSQPKRSKIEISVVEEEGVFEIDWRYGDYLYEKWMWGSMEDNRFAFPTVSMWYWLVVLKEKLWQRYNIFYDADTIEEVFPENEVAGWVWEACNLKKEPRVVWRDRELSFEWTNDWCGRQAPREIRTYEEEVEVQLRRRQYRKGTFAWNTGEGLKMPWRPRNRRLTAEEEARFCEERRLFWERRRCPCKAQHDAREPNHLKWDALQENSKKRAEVSERE